MSLDTSIAVVHVQATPHGVELLATLNALQLLMWDSEALAISTCLLVDPACMRPIISDQHDYCISIFWT